MTPSVTKQLNLMVGEILSILPSLKAYWEGIRFLNQSTCPSGMKYLVSMEYLSEGSLSMYTFWGKNRNVDGFCSKGNKERHGF